jgi:hypothetical protein
MDFEDSIKLIQEALDAAALALAENHGRTVVDDGWRQTRLDFTREFDLVEAALACVRGA